MESSESPTELENVSVDDVAVAEHENGMKLVDNWDDNTDCHSLSTISNGFVAEILHIISVDVLLHPSSTLPDDVVASLVVKHIKRTIFGRCGESVEPLQIVVKDLSRVLNMSDTLRRHVREMTFEESDGLPVISLSRYKDAKWRVYVYKMQDDGEPAEISGEESPAATHQILPSLAYHRLWDCLIYDIAIKKDLLNYAMDIVLFSRVNVDSNLVTWNKVVLLHGPPGTGKTSLCKALAQKLSIRMAEHYPAVYFMEINSHSLFSKWFSESGKLVTKLFRDIEEVIQQKSAPLVCLLLDEVESLARARQAAVAGNEPSDAVRAVNALLTQIDKIKQYPNVLILTTSNISGAIDLAFVDRADIKQYIGNPSAAARESIILSGLQELVKKGVLLSDPALLANDETVVKSLLKRVSGIVSEGLSGRSLRKIPFLTHALKFPGILAVGLRPFLEAMEGIIMKHQSDVRDLSR